MKRRVRVPKLQAMNVSMSDRDGKLRYVKYFVINIFIYIYIN